MKIIKGLSALVIGLGLSTPLEALAEGLITEQLMLDSPSTSRTLVTNFRKDGFEQYVAIRYGIADGPLFERTSSLRRPSKPSAGASKAEKKRYAKRLKTYNRKKEEARQVIAWEKKFHEAAGASLERLRELEKISVASLDEMVGRKNYDLVYAYDIKFDDVTVTLQHRKNDLVRVSQFAFELDKISERCLNEKIRVGLNPGTERLSAACDSVIEETDLGHAAHE
jgi:hypothetical protein